MHDVSSDSGGARATTTSAFFFDGDQVVLAFQKVGSSNATITDRFTWAVERDHLLADEQAISFSSAGTVYWTTSDHLNTVRDVLTYNSGTDTSSVAKHIVPDSFGNITTDTATGIVILFGYAGRYTDQTTGDTNNTYRWYAPSLGRFRSEDPIKDGLNWQIYVGNRPTYSTDPNGLEIVQATFSNAVSGHNARVTYVDVAPPVTRAAVAALAWPTEQLVGWKLLTPDQQRLYDNFVRAGGTGTAEIIDIFQEIYDQGEYVVGMETCFRYVSDLNPKLPNGQVKVALETWNYNGYWPAWSFHAVLRLHLKGITIGYIDNGYLGGYFGDHIFFQHSIPDVFYAYKDCHKYLEDPTPPGDKCERDDSYEWGIW